MAQKPQELGDYFRDNSINPIDQQDGTVSVELNETAKSLSNLILEDQNKSINKSEPEICRLFSETKLDDKSSTAAFFDLISNKNSASNGIISDLRLTNNDDDGFCARVAVGSEAERRRDAWIPSEQTRQILINCATSVPGTYVPDKEFLTMPGILLEEDLGDSVGETVASCLGEAEAAQRQIISANDVTQDERGLRDLVQAGAYRAAINLSASLLTIYGQGKGRTGHQTKHSPHSLQLWFTRIALLIKSKEFRIAHAEAEAFGQLDKPDIFYQFYPEIYGDRPGSIASFSFRLLLAELPMHCGNSKDSLTRLFSILATVKQIIQNLKKGLCEDGNPMEISENDRSDSIRLWTGRETRVMHSIINCAIYLQHYELAMEMLEQLCKRDETHKHMLLSALGRLHLQVGDISSAELCFNEARALKGETPDLRELVDRGLLAVAQNNFNEAFYFFEEASALEPNNLMILNNMGVCLLYGGRLKEAIAVLESAIAINPPHALHESILLNLCTLYDMESSKGRKKKFALLKQISRYRADAPTTILEKLYG